MRAGALMPNSDIVQIYLSIVAGGSLPNSDKGQGLRERNPHFLGRPTPSLASVALGLPLSCRGGLLAQEVLCVETGLWRGSGGHSDLHH